MKEGVTAEENQKQQENRAAKNEEGHGAAFGRNQMRETMKSTKATKKEMEPTEPVFPSSIIFALFVSFVVSISRGSCRHRLILVVIS
jgi:hypothetical protein